MTGIGMGFSSSLIPQLEADDSELRLSRDQNAWIASVFSAAGPLGSLAGGYVMDAGGRMRAVQLALVPVAAGWVLMALAQSFLEMLVGRLIQGAFLGMSFSAGMLYTTEVAEKDIRGMLSCMGASITSLGVLLCYCVGAYVPWRAAAWGFGALPLLLMGCTVLLSSESPVWLNQKGRLQAARKASTRFYDDPDKVLSASKNAELDAETSMWQRLRLLFTTSTGIKPFIMLNVLFVAQQTSGIYITIFYAVTFLQDSGSDLDPYVATILIGLLRLVLSTAVALTAGSIGRRPAFIVSSVGMGACMLGCALATQSISAAREAGAEPEAWLSWTVVVLLLLFVVFSSAGLTVLPWSMMAEVFPHEVRSVSQPINSSLVSLYVFAGVQLYPTVASWIGGSAGVMYLFAASSFLVAVFSWAFVVETRGRTLYEIEEYFSNNLFYPWSKSKQKRSSVTTGA